MRILYWSDYRFRVEFGLLLGLVIALPMFEGLKNILWLLYGLAWYVNRLRPGISWEEVGGRPDAWDALIIALLIAAPLGAAFAGIHDHEWTACYDSLRMVSMLWFLKRSGYGNAEWLHLHITIQGALVIAAVWALIALALPHSYEGIQLNSVGHVNQSVIYIVIGFGALIGGVAAYWRRMHVGWRVAAIVALGIDLAALFAAGSRAAAATAIIGAFAFSLLWMKRSRGPIVWTAVVVATFAVLVTTLDTDMRRKQEFALDSAHPFLNERYPIWQQALVAWRAHPAFGIGGDNFSDITAARIETWSRAAGAPYDMPEFVDSTHAHSLYLNTLAEHGMLGLAMLVALCAAWTWTLVRDKPASADPPLAWLAWSGAAAALLVTLGLGAFNTTLHDEHGLLALMMLGIWLGYRRERLSGVGARAAATVR
jgi:O-antigen ligase